MYFLLQVFKESQQGEEAVGDDCGPFFSDIRVHAHFLQEKAIRQIMYYCILAHHGCSAVLFLCPSKLPARPDANGHLGLRQLLPRPNDLQMLTRAPYGP